MNLTHDEERGFLLAKDCYVCGSPFTEKDYKVRDHDHTSGSFRGTAHNSCNLKLKPPNHIPVFVHNLSR